MHSLIFFIISLSLLAFKTKSFFLITQFYDINV